MALMEMTQVEMTAMGMSPVGQIHMVMSPVEELTVLLEDQANPREAATTATKWTELGLTRN